MKLGQHLFAAVAAIAACAAPAYAGPVVVTGDPGGTTTQIGARLRWGGTGFEASIFDADPFGQTPTLNPSGAPVWQVGSPYAFQVDFNATTGSLGLSVDFDRNGTYGSGESISRSVFAGTSSYAGGGFDYLSIFGNEAGSTGRSTIENLAINGTALSSLAPNGGSLETFYVDGSGGQLGPVTITGTINFTAAGTAQERPTWDFRFREAAAVPDGGATLSLLGFALAGVGVLRRTLR